MLRKLNDVAVSPVVGVMLLLIITIIIAAVSSGFAGGLMDSTGKAPTLSMDVHIKNNGYWSGSEFSAKVTGVDSAIPTKDLKIITSWTHNDYIDGKISGGTTIEPNQPNVYLVWSPYNGKNYLDQYFYVAPYGYGIGVGDEEGSAGSGSGQGSDKKIHFGNYSLAIGTVMWAEPFGANTRPSAGAYTGVAQTLVGYGITNITSGTGGRWSYLYNDDTGYIGGSRNGDADDPDGVSILGNSVELVFNPPDESGLNGRMNEFIGSANYHDLPNYDAMTAVLGAGWENLRAGDIVTVSVVHTPTGKTIWEKDVVVEG
ncbi:MAG: type IV pilin N-terminal domain-containing protein [Methanomicrobiaceae archaeon]|nr:type IV pilin N-terminal domain-containing protein [Methanomicrobiaceae archaeon]